ncbi:hypothetical protein ACHAW6_002497, partial [Cyclotella cf. meneghiniana]
VQVSSFDPTQPAQKAKVIDAAIKYTRRDTGDPMILQINQAILVLINGVEINEVPRFLTSDPTISSHSIVIANPTDDAHHYTILLQLEGVVSYFEYTLQTSAEYKDDDIPHLQLTAGSPINPRLYDEQIFATDFEWSQSFPMSCKSQTNEAPCLRLHGRASRPR